MDTIGLESSSSDTGAMTEGEADDVPVETNDESSGGPICGDGQLDPGEDCDLGPANAWELAECQPDCSFNECGDGFLGLDETCEPPLCSPDCQLPVLPCDNKVLECGDGIDNDEDGLVDLYDPDCLSPCDDDEAALRMDLPGTGGASGCKFDCFFDDNTGLGDDTCEWRLQCDPLNPGQSIGCEYDPMLAMSPLCTPLDEQPPACLQQCLPITANGCDCFGCCEIDGQFRWLELAECSVESIEQCLPCTPHPSCFNPCEADQCEQCLLAELAPGCDQPSCPEGVEPCADPYACPEGQFCQTGCCRPIAPEWP